MFLSFFSFSSVEPTIHSQRVNINSSSFLLCIFNRENYASGLQMRLTIQTDDFKPAFSFYLVIGFIKCEELSTTQILIKSLLLDQ